MLRERAIPGLACRILGAFAARVSGIDVHLMQRYSEARTDCLAMPREIIGRGLQAMMNMDCVHIAGPSAGGGQQQGRGIGTATERDRER
jgi:hypothetical protein